MEKLLMGTAFILLGVALVEALFNAIAGLSIYELPLNAQNQLNGISAASLLRAWPRTF
jgi:hypothetical protein